MPAIFEAFTSILEQLDKGKTVAGIYFDLSRAFDMVDHELLLYKLECYGVR